MEPIYINQSEVNKNLLGFLSLSLDEQIAKKIYEATGDKTFKGFLPLTWNTAQIVKMRDAMDRLKTAGKLTVLNMQMQNPAISAAAYQYFIANAGKIKSLIPTPGDILKPLTPVFVIAGLAAAAYLLSQVKSLVPKRRLYE